MMEDTIRHLESSTTPSLHKQGTVETKAAANGGAKAKGKSGGSTGAAQRKPSSNATGNKRTVEIIIVDDGSTDKTSSVALDLAKKYASYDIRVVTLEKNIGKGGAVRHGMLYSSGERLLMADADGASRIDDLEALWTTMDELSREDNVPAVVVGSRAHLVKTEAVVKRSFIRNVLMYGLHTVLRIVGVGHIRDTQCGFKLFSRSAAQQIFPSQHLPTWIFDVELLLLAKYLRIPVAEVPIEWHEVAGSKLNVVTASVQMLRDLLIVRANHMLGIWKPVPVKKVE
ncbi:nucleotide-diphospho-sugar transferase [Coprinopsis sp. MPI-PUGE-AT-0042]|nr:nucleotide-diphospho-sugar transferase [Coprinopsis sp. MPI-PUGE-AT-0042]